MQCPSCHKEVDVKDKDVGALFTCPLCRSVYFINFDGTPEYGEVQQPSDEELKKLQNAAVPEKKKKKKKKKDDDELDQQQEAQPDTSTEVFTLEPEPEAIHLEVEPLPIEALPMESPTIENFSYEAVSANNEGQFQQAEDFNSIASEIENFGNQQTAVAGISYDLDITGLDTKESQELLREAIDDLRFGWHPEDIVRQIRTGTCKFKDLTPVQAFVLARRVQFIDVEMKWKQNVLA